MADTSQYVIGYLNGVKTTFTDLASAKQNGATNIQPYSTTSTSTAPKTTSSTSPAGTTSTSSGGSGGNFTQYVKTASSPTVYGKTSDGRWVAFETGDQFTGSGGSFNNVQIVGSVPSGAVNYSQWKPTAQTGITGDATLDGVLGELDKYIQDQAAAGNKFNPNIELSPKVVQQFLDQATKEISPYYTGQINAIKDRLSSSLGNLQKNYELQKENQLASFQKNLGQTRENLAAGGAAYSGFRGQEEESLKKGVDRSLTGLGLQTAESANNALATARQAIGTKGISGVNLPTFSGYSASTSGTGSFSPTRSLDFNTFSSPLTGSMQYDQTRDIRNLTDYLKSQEVNKRILSF